MPKYRSIPKIVDAEQFFVDKKPWPEGVHVAGVYPNNPVYWVITIHKQQTIIVDGDWIITEPDGRHHYPCKPDIFEQTYEKVEMEDVPSVPEFTLNGISVECNCGICTPISEGNEV